MGQGEEETEQKGHFTFCQEPGREKIKNKPTTICLSRMAGWLPWHRGPAVPGGKSWLCHPATLPGKGSGSGWLCPGSAPAPSTAPEQQ